MCIYLLNGMLQTHAKPCKLFYLKAKAHQSQGAGPEASEDRCLVPKRGLGVRTNGTAVLTMALAAVPRGVKW